MFVLVDGWMSLNVWQLMSQLKLIKDVHHYQKKKKYNKNNLKNDIYLH